MDMVYIRCSVSYIYLWIFWSRIMKFLVTYKDVVEANSEEEARERLIRVLESDVACKDVDSFEFTNLNDDFRS